MSSSSLINGKPYYYSFDLGRVPSIYDFIHSDDGADDAGCKCNDACVKCKVVNVTNNKNNWTDSPYAFFNRQTNDYKHSYFLVNYDKKILQKRIDDGVEYGYEQYVRSVILNANRNIVCFSPPMCEPVPRSKESGSGSNIKNVLEFSKVKFAEEFVEGTMVNLFYNPSNDVESWEFSTRTVVSPAEKRGNGSGSGVVDKKCFRRMFLEACAAVGLKFDDLQKEYSYSFVLQHPDNTIVAPVKSMALFIVAMYYIDGTTVYEMDRSIIKWGEFSSVRHPARFGLLNGEEDFEKIINVWASNDSLYYYPGVMFRTHEGARYKFRNPNYEYVKNAKGVVEKSRFVYLHLKKLGKLQSHFDRFPENELEFFRHSTNFYNYMHNLHKNYMECYIYKRKPLKEFAVEYKRNMFDLHEHYKMALRTNGKCVKITDMSFVIEFMNEQSLSSQLFILKKFEDSVNVIDIKVEHVENGKLQENEEDMNKQCPGAPRKCKC